ncbi:MAG TPA: HDIG domain-containing protein [Anaerolineales bacterium]|nr:HDIG domain-containing protein [Anaerolineales bacterium]
MDDTASAGTPFLARLRKAWRDAGLWLILAAGAAGMVLALSAPLTTRSESIRLEIGDVASQDLLAPYPLSFSSESLTEEARIEAAEAVPEVFDPPDAAVARQQLESLRLLLTFVEAVRSDRYATPEQRLADLASVNVLRLDSATAQALLNLPESRWQAVKVETTSVLEQVMRSEIREGRVDSVRRAVPALVSITFPEDQAGLVAQLATAFIAPNSLFNDAATQAARADAEASVSPVIKTYAAGETIVARGQVVEPVHLEALRAYGLLQAPEAWRSVAVDTLLVTVLAGLIVMYLFRVHPILARSTRMALFLAVAFFLNTLFMQLMIPGHTVLPYLFPAATLPMLLAVVFGPGMGLAGAVVTGTLAGYLSANGLEVGMYAGLSAAMGALVLGRAERLSSFFWAGVGASLAATAVVVVFRFPDASTDVLGKATLLGAAGVNGLLAASLAFGLLLLAGNLLGIVTNIQLIELSRPDHPLLLFILRNAPGTYQHSLQVANLAEQAARAIGANALLTRVGALYHDAGKALRPQFYIENQTPEQNIHEQLDPATSASVIQSHVREGLDLARKYRLPRQIQAFIPEHHGTLEMTYQYRAAVEAAGGSESQVDAKDFAYPGPRPRSRETAILMLADGVEAKARAELPHDEAAIEQLVDWVIRDRLQRGQLDRTDLTLKDLDTIRRSLTISLKGIYHPRLRYPESEEAVQAEAGAALEPLPSPSPKST